MRDTMHTAAQEKQALEIARAYASKAKRRYVGMSDVESLEGAAYLGAAKALTSFNPDRAVKFSTWAIHLIRGEILEEARHQDHLPRSLRDRFRRRQQEGEETPLWAERALPVEDLGLWYQEDWLEDTRPVRWPWEEEDEPRDVPFEHAAHTLACRELQRRVDRLTARQQQCIRLYYWDGLTGNEIARQMGVSESCVWKHHTEALRRLRHGLGRDPFVG